MSRRRQVIRQVILMGLAFALVCGLRVVLAGAARRPQFLAGWLLLAVQVWQLWSWRGLGRQLRAGRAPGSADPGDALRLTAITAVAGLHVDLGLPEGRFEYLLFLILMVLVAGEFRIWFLSTNPGGPAPGAGQQAALEQAIELLLPFQLAALPVEILHGVLAQAHGALAHLAHGLQP